MKRLECVTLGVLLTVLALVSCSRTPGPGAAAVDGAASETSRSADTVPETTSLKSASPALRITTLDGADYDLANHRGKWVVVNFWATWCKPCLKEMPELSEMDRDREHIEVIGLAYEDIDADTMRAFLARHPVGYPIAILDMYHPLADFEEPRGLPMTYVIAPDGSVAKQILGPVTSADIEAVVAAAGGSAEETGTASAADTVP